MIPIKQYAARLGISSEAAYKRANRFFKTGEITLYGSKVPGKFIKQQAGERGYILFDGPRNFEEYHRGHGEEKKFNVHATVEHPEHLEVKARSKMNADYIAKSKLQDKYPGLKIRIK